jgi:phage protein U
MFAQLGTIQFNLITYFSFIEELKKKGYSELRRLQNKPRLQKKGDDLDRITIQLKFHNSFCDPAYEFNRLKEAADKDEALPFVYGNGVYQGNYIIEQIKSNTKQTDSRGGIIAIEVELQLVEYVEDDPITIKKIKKKAEAKKKSTAVKKVKKEFDPYSNDVQDYLDVSYEEVNQAQIDAICRKNYSDEYIEILTKPKETYIDTL